MVKQCHKCTSTNQCEVSSSDQCWCFSLPSLQLLNELIGEQSVEEISCLCKPCLLQELNVKIAKYATLVKKGTLVNEIPELVNDSKRLIDGLDYYKEGGNWVFTSWHHLKRGHCCGNGCRHCPYPK